jgi:L-gulonolactone oxidase
MTAAADGTWTNWARTATARPARICAPASVAELCEEVARAVRDGLRVRMVGSGHSFTDVAVTDGLMLRPDRLRGIETVDAATRRVTVLAGTPLHELGPALWAHGLALANLGDIDRQTVAGALATGTHGTGEAHGSLASQVVGFDLVSPAGELVSVDATSAPELFHAARVGLGAFGVMTRITLQCVSAFGLQAVERPGSLDAVLEDLDAFFGSADHVEFYWFPHTRRVLQKVNTRIGPVGLQPLPAWRARLDDDLLSNTVFEGLNRVATAAPPAIPTLNAVAARALSARTFSDRSYRVFASSRTVVFRESEFAIPQHSTADVLREMDRWFTASGERVAFPVEVRVGPAEDAWLATAHGRDTAYISVHQYHRRPHDRYFDAVAAIMREARGRPHWGKLHSLDGADLSALYPNLDRARALRDDLDPGSHFRNAYTDQVFGS